MLSYNNPSAANYHVNNKSAICVDLIAANGTGPIDLASAEYPATFTIDGPPLFGYSTVSIEITTNGAATGTFAVHQSNSGQKPVGSVASATGTLPGSGSVFVEIPVFTSKYALIEFAGATAGNIRQIIVVAKQ